MGRAGCWIVTPEDTVSPSPPLSRSQGWLWGVRQVTPLTHRAVWCLCGSLPGEIPAFLHQGLRPGSPRQPQATRKFIRLVKLQGSNLIVSFSPCPPGGKLLDLSPNSEPSQRVSTESSKSNEPFVPGPRDNYSSRGSGTCSSSCPDRGAPSLVCGRQSGSLELTGTERRHPSSE